MNDCELELAERIAAMLDPKVTDVTWVHDGPRSILLRMTIHYPDGAKSCRAVFYPKEWNDLPFDDIEIED